MVRSRHWIHRPSLLQAELSSERRMGQRPSRSFFKPSITNAILGGEFPHRRSNYFSAGLTVCGELKSSPLPNGSQLMLTMSVAFRYPCGKPCIGISKKMGAGWTISGSALADKMEIRRRAEWIPGSFLSFPDTSGRKSCADHRS